MGTWYHVAGVFNDGGYAKIYVNGVFQQSSNLHGQSLSEVSSPVYIGGASFTGAVDEVRIYNYALSASQVCTSLSLSLSLSLALFEANVVLVGCRFGCNHSHTISSCG